MSTKLKPKLEKSLEESVAVFRQLSTSSDVARFLEVPEKQLLYILYTLPDIKKYEFFKIKKKRGGYRQIKAPIKGTAILLNKLKPVLQELYRPKRCVHGFVRNKSVVSNAKEHRRRKYVLNVDLDDFYGHINFGRIRGLFMAKPFEIGPKAATVLAQLCTHDNSLPQGSPVSPILSNFIAADLDNKLTALAGRYNLYYTRYADDITFSTTKGEFPSHIAYFEGSNPITGNTFIGKKLERAISSSGFKINSGKVRLQIPSVRQEVTGLTVNEFPNVERKYVRKIRAMVHAWKKYGLIEAEREHLLKYAKSPPDIDSGELDGTYYKNVLYGHLAYLKMVRGENDEIYIKLCLEMVELDPDVPKKMQQLIADYENYDVFICHASEDKEDVARPLAEGLISRGYSVWYDEFTLVVGDSLLGSIEPWISTVTIRRGGNQSKFLCQEMASKRTCWTGCPRGSGN